MSREILIVLPLMVMGTAQASEWAIRPQVYTRAEHVDNPRLAADEKAVDGAVTEASIAMSRRTEISELAITPSIQHREYSGDGTLDGTDASVRSAWRLSGERDVWSVGASWSRESTLTSELGTTGFTQTNKWRETLDGSAELEHQLTDRLTLDAGIDGMSATYRDARFTGLVDYRYFTANLGADYIVGERLRVSFNATAGRLDVPELPRAASRQFGVTAQASYAWSPLWRITAFAGPSRIEDEAGADEGAAFGVSLGRSGERSSLSASLSRMAKPTGRGVLVRQDVISLSQRFRWTERLTTELNLSAVRSEDVIRTLRAETIEYRHADTTLIWDWSAHLSARVTVANSSQRWNRPDRQAHGYSAALGITWTPALLTFWH